MPSFRDRPLTWLFFIAAGCVAVVDFTQSRQQMLTALILTGIVYIAGAWAAVGKAHRLARGAVMFIAPLAAALPIYLLAPRTGEAGAVLAIALLASAVSYAASMVTSLFVLASVPRKSTGQGAHWWRFSLSEILGWTVVTAIASVAVSKAEVPAGMEWELVWIVVTSSIPCGVMIALFLVPQPHSDRAATILSAIVTVVWYVLSTLITNSGPSFDFFGVGAQLLGFIGLWILCVRLDESALAAKDALAEAPALKIHDESVSDA